jgi:NAD-dependent deacetylase
VTGRPLPRLALDEDTFVLVLTGAGVSAESGIPTFRASGGFWEAHPVEKVASPEGFARDPVLVWRFYSERRRQAKTCAPNPGHRALQALEERLGDHFLLATQNVDGLHRRAGSRRLVELHGNVHYSRCTACAGPPFLDEVDHIDTLPCCELCAARGERHLLRPHIVWFGEFLDPQDLEQVDAFMREAARGRFVFLAVGTSGAVYPAAGFVAAARARGGDTWLVNAEPADNTTLFHHFVEGRSGEVLPELLGVTAR